MKNPRSSCTKAVSMMTTPWSGVGTARISMILRYRLPLSARALGSGVLLPQQGDPVWKELGAHHPVGDRRIGQHDRPRLVLGLRREDRDAERALVGIQRA